MAGSPITPGWWSRIPEPVARARLVESASTSHLVVLEAPAGAGKSTLVTELAAAHDGPSVTVVPDGAAGPNQLRSRLLDSLRDHGLSDLADLVEASGDPDPVPTLLSWLDDRGESLLLVVDDLHRASDEVVDRLTDIAGRWRAPHRLVLSGRRLPDPLAVATASGRMVGPEELRFRPDETRALLGVEVTAALDDTEVSLLTERCEGWAAALALAAGQLERAATSPGAVERAIADLLTRPTTLSSLLASLLAVATPDARRAVEQLAALPAFDDALAQAAGFERGAAQLADLGLPIVEAGHGLSTLPNAVRDVLASEPDEHLVRLAAQRYLEADRPVAALQVLDAAELKQDLAKLLADLPPEVIGHLDPADHAAAVGALPHELLAAHPRILLHLADSYVVDGHLEDYRETIGRARTIVDRYVDEDDPARLEVVAADLTMRARASDDDTLIGEAEELMSRADLPAVARARLLGAVGRATASRATTSALRAAARLLDEAAQTFQREGAIVHATATRVIGATVALWPLGRYDAALDQLGQALEAGRGSSRIRVATLPYQAFILIELGRYAEAEAVLAELRRTARNVATVGNERAAAFASWGAAALASQRGDAEATWAACQAVERSEVVVDTGHGAFFRADAAQLLARVGRHDEAARLLADARARDPGTTSLVTMGALAVAAYAGDLVEVERALTELDGGATAEPRDRWRVTLLHAYARHLAGDPAARSLAAAAFEEAAQLGYPELPMIREPAAARALRATAAESSASARDAAAGGGVSIRLLGGFLVERDSTVTEPSGRPAQLLAFLALNGRQATAERVIEALWPDTEPARGRERLRTVLRRVRREFGDLVERHDDTLRLTDRVSVDADEFLTFARRAASASPPSVSAASSALALYRGEVAPSLGYQDWAVDARDRLQRRALAMQDLVAEAAEHDGRLDDAIRALEAALELDPLAEDRYLAAARLLAEQGRRSRALQLLARARAALEGAEIAASDELARLEAYLRRDPVVTTGR